MTRLSQTLHCETDTRDIALAREILYRYLTAALTDPRLPAFRTVLDSDNQTMANSASEFLRNENENDPIPLGFGELPTDKLDVTALIDEFRRPFDDLLKEYDRVFGVAFTSDCPPYETEYCANQEPFFRAQQLADIAGFYRAFGLDVSSMRPERADHIALELEFMGLLLSKERMAVEGEQPLATERAELCSDAQRAFVTDHLNWWIPSYATGLSRKAEAGPYAEVARVLAAFLPTERSRFGIKAPQLPVRPRSIERPEEQTGCVGCS